MKQRGAIFGLDIRMAIVIGGLMAVALSAEMISDFEGNRQTRTERTLENLRDALIDRYSGTTSSTFTNTLETLYDGQAQNLVRYGEASGAEAVDGWGQTLAVSTTSATENLLGVSVTVHYGIIVSSGPNKTFNSSTIVANRAAYQAWAPVGDDFGIKFNTVLVERDRIVRMREQQRVIMEALAAYAQRREAEHTAICTASSCNCNTDANNCTSLGVPYCDRTSDHLYCPGEEKLYNFYPTDTTEAAANSTLAYNVVRGLATYTSGNLTSMQNLLTLIGLPTALATDPWGRTMRYSSNQYATTNPPYTAAVWYQ